MASYAVNERAVEKARQLIAARQYVLDSDWGDVQPRAADENRFLASHSWEEYAEWRHKEIELAAHEWFARYAFSASAFGWTSPQSLSRTYWRERISCFARATARSLTL